MKPETDPISPDEWLIRLVFHTRFTAKAPIIGASAFEPRVVGDAPDVDGISLFRRDCLNEPTDALLAIRETSRSLTGLVQLPVSLFTELGLSVRVKCIPESAGHVVISELNSTVYAANKARFTPIRKRLAEVASENILRRPPSTESDDADKKNG